MLQIVTKKLFDPSKKGLPLMLCIEKQWASTQWNCRNWLFHSLDHQHIPDRRGIENQARCPHIYTLPHMDDQSLPHLKHNLPFILCRKCSQILNIWKHCNFEIWIALVLLPVILWKHAVWRMPWNISNPIIAYMMITKRTRSAIWKSGIIAISIAFKTIWRPLLKWKFVSYF